VNSQKITFIGAGQMGMPMVHRLVAAGHSVTVFARRQHVREECAGAGAAVSDDVMQAVRDSDVVVVCLYSDPQINDLALGADGFLEAMKRESLLIDHTTGSPSTVRTLATAGADLGLHVVDAPVSGSAQDIADGHVTVLLGGEPNDVARAREVVRAYGEPIFHVGPLGSGQAVKLINNALFAANMQLAGEAVRLAAGFDVDPSTLAATVQHSSGASFAMNLVEQFGSIEQVAALAGHFLRKDVDTVMAVAADLGLELGELAHVNQHGPLRYEGRTG
jgi:3-hydroxyisobutyrate dehydrogenase-like beta-hydroxyacid dehydrogenase